MVVPGTALAAPAENRQTGADGLPALLVLHIEQDRDTGAATDPACLRRRCPPGKAGLIHSPMLSAPGRRRKAGSRRPSPRHNRWCENGAVPHQMHDDEVALPPAQVGRLIEAQFPRWSGLPIARLRSSGTDHAIFRLGPALGIRMPRVAWAVGTLEREYAWLPVLAGSLPAEVPTPLALGRPGESYPWTWTVFRWVDGANPVAGWLGDPDGLAADLAAFIAALHAIDPAGAPPTVWSRPLHEEDARVRAALPDLPAPIDIAAVEHAWEVARAAPPCGERTTWIHGDLAPGNLLVVDDRLHGVIDFGAMGIGDPASDLRPAWNLLPPGSRKGLQERLALDDAQWSRGRGWALLQAVAQIEHFDGRNPVLTANACRVLDEIAAEVAAGLL